MCGQPPVISVSTTQLLCSLCLNNLCGVKLLNIMLTLSMVLCADVRDYENWIPLHCACFGGHKDVVQYLVENAKCDISECNTTTMQCYTFVSTCSGVFTDDGETPLDIATRRRHTEITDYLKSLMSTQCGPIQLLSAAVTGDSDSRSEENGPTPTKERKGDLL